MSDALTDSLRELVRGIVREEMVTLRRPTPAVRLLSINEACELAGVGRSFMYDAMRDNRIRSVKLGRRRLIPSDAIAELGRRS